MNNFGPKIRILPIRAYPLVSDLGLNLIEGPKRELPMLSGPCYMGYDAPP